MKNYKELIMGFLILACMSVVLYGFFTPNIDIPVLPEEPIAEPIQPSCTEEARECPDGSFVARALPNCEFAQCPVDVVVEPVIKPPVDDIVFCTQDAKQCEDGSYVGRTGPNCEFAKCPPFFQEEPIGKSPIICSEASKIVDACIEIYQPVCGLVEVQCITTPCNPVPQTFSNSCHACAQGNVVSYGMGECSVDG